jgi:hypothetical protein
MKSRPRRRAKEPVPTSETLDAMHNNSGLENVAPSYVATDMQGT